MVEVQIVTKSHSCKDIFQCKVKQYWACKAVISPLCFGIPWLETENGRKTDKSPASTIMTMLVPDQIPNSDSKWSQIRKDQHSLVTRQIEEMLNTAQLGRLATFTANKEGKVEIFTS